MKLKSALKIMDFVFPEKTREEQIDIIEKYTGFPSFFHYTKSNNTEVLCFLQNLMDYVNGKNKTYHFCPRCDSKEIFEKVVCKHCELILLEKGEPICLLQNDLLLEEFDF